MASPEPAPTTPQYRAIRCPNCGNLSFRFVEVDGVLHRQCTGPKAKSCDHTWDCGDEGRKPR